MSRVRIVQLLCPKRHALCGHAYLSDDGDPIAGKVEEVKTAYKEWGGLMICGICQSTDIHAEDAVTRFATMEESRAALLANEAEQLLTRALIESEKKRVERN